MGVRMMPGPTALSGIPDAAHSGVTARSRTHSAIARFVDG